MIPLDMARRHFVESLDKMTSNILAVFIIFYSFADFFNHLLQQWRHRFAGWRIDGVDFAFALGVGGGVAALKQVVVVLVDPAGAGLAEFSFFCKNKIVPRRTAM